MSVAKTITYAQRLYYKGHEVTLLDYLPNGMAEIMPVGGTVSRIVSIDQLTIQQVRLCNICCTNPADGKDNLCQDCRVWEGFKSMDDPDEQGG